MVAKNKPESWDILQMVENKMAMDIEKNLKHSGFAENVFNKYPALEKDDVLLKDFAKQLAQFGMNFIVPLINSLQSQAEIIGFKEASHRALETAMYACLSQYVLEKGE